MIWKQVGQSLTGLMKHVFGAVVSEPIEVVKDAVGKNFEKGNQTQQQSGADPAQQNLNDLAKAGFKTQDDFVKYVGLSGQKDQIELEMTRKQLIRQWGLDTNIESGMQRARMEYEEMEKQRKEVKEKEEEQKKEFEFQKKQQEDLALTAAKSEASAETKAWGAG